jgi:hypothetical protein
MIIRYFLNNRANRKRQENIKFGAGHSRSGKMNGGSAF